MKAKLGSKLFVFRIEDTGTTPVIQERVLLGTRINKNSGERVYEFDGFSVPEYAVSDDKVEIENKIVRFLEYKKVLNEAMDKLEGIVKEFQADMVESEALELLAKERAEDVKKVKKLSGGGDGI